MLQLFTSHLFNILGKSLWYFLNSHLSFGKDDMAGMFHISSKQRTTLQLRDGVNKKREFSLFENIIRKHRNGNDKSMVFIQFRLAESELGWSGPLCISSLGRFFLKFRKQSGQVTEPDNNVTEFASVHVAEEGSTLVVHFHRPPIANLPYRIENCLNCASITYYQKVLTFSHFPCVSNVKLMWNGTNIMHVLIVFQLLLESFPGFFRARSSWIWMQC